MQIALLRWYEAIQTGDNVTIAVSPRAMAFDGLHVWVASNWSGTLTKIRAADGAVVDNYSLSIYPCALTLDGLNMWVADEDAPVVLKVRASDGTAVDNCTVDQGPKALAFNGTNIWVANGYDGTLTKI